jgi:hypothetical protein
MQTPTAWKGMRAYSDMPVYLTTLFLQCFICRCRDVPAEHLYQIYLALT